MGNPAEWLRAHMREHALHPDELARSEKILRFPQTATEPTTGTEARDSAALDLVYQAAEAIRGIEDRAKAAEARARGLAQDVGYKLRQAEDRIQALEAERRSFKASMQETGLKIQAAEQAFEQAQARISAAEAQLLAADSRARAAEARANQSEKALRSLENAIRTHLLGQNATKTR